MDRVEHPDGGRLDPPRQICRANESQSRRSDILARGRYVTQAERKDEYRGIIPTTPILILRFPDGDVEWRSTRGEMPVGAIVRARGVDWRVRAHVDHTVELEPVDSDGAAGPAGGPVTRPTPLGDRPLTFEILQEA